MVMKKIRAKIILSVVAAVMMAIIPAAKALQTVTLTQNAYSYDVGGEFNAVTSPSFLGNYASVAMVNGGFETFCIQTTVEFWPGTTYNFVLSSQDSMGRALTLGAAFLYYQFATGQLAGYDYNNAAARKSDAGLLQAALWWLQGNQTYNDGKYEVPTIGNNEFYALAVNTLGLANVTLASNGAYGVEILQMWGDTGRPAQNQLVLTSLPSVPDGGLTALMLALAVGIIIWLRHKAQTPALQRI